MNNSISQSIEFRSKPATAAQSPKLLFWLLLLAVCNITLLKGQVAQGLIFIPEAVWIGDEWYRLFLAPFVHVSWYHLALDAAAFLLLLNGLQEAHFSRRFTFLLGSWAGSLTAPLLLSERVYEIGLCGLSGIAHGLFAVTALEIAFRSRDKSSRILGTTLLVGMAAKIGWELLSGGMLMTTLHFGSVGTPIVSSHFGGALGGSLAFILTMTTDKLLRDKG